MTDPQRATDYDLFGSESPALVRPSTAPGGRTRPRHQLAIEALVRTEADPASLVGLLPEHQRICGLCRETRSVAEVSALLSIPLGVARILVADLAEAGLVVVHQPGAYENEGAAPDVGVLERTLSGLRRMDAAPTRAPTDLAGDATVERRLGNGYEALLAALDEVLDVEAGLREALGEPPEADE